MSLDEPSPIVLVNAVGLTGRLLEHAPRLKALAGRGWKRSLTEVLPAVTTTAQATILTGVGPEVHGVVGNGWLFRDTGEVRFWQQSNRLMQSEPMYARLKREAAAEGRDFRAAKLFWWFNQGASVDISVTPKPYYGADGNKVFGIAGTPLGLTDRLEQRIGKFPFHTFWGPGAGLPCTDWIGRCAAQILADPSGPPDLTLVYLPHLDYDPQRFGVTASDMPRLVGELDAACAPLLDAAARAGARVWVVSEYGHCDVSRPIYLNRLLREHGFIEARGGPFGEVLDTFNSRAFAVVDHQLAHIYIQDPKDIEPVRSLLAGSPGVASVHAGEERKAIGLDHERSGEVIVLSEPDAWFAYAYWLDDALAPDFARTVDIHRKPGYDPCEILFDPKLIWPKGRAIRRLIQKKLGFRTLFDVIPLDASLIKGSHGLRASNDLVRPILIGDGPAPGDGPLPMTDVHRLLLNAFGRGA